MFSALIIPEVSHRRSTCNSVMQWMQGENLLTNQTDSAWRSVRKTTAPGFSPARLRYIVPLLPGNVHCTDPVILAFFLSHNVKTSRNRSSHRPAFLTKTVLERGAVWVEDPGFENLQGCVSGVVCGCQEASKHFGRTSGWHQLRYGEAVDAHHVGLNW